jgi:hypothetical protein
MKSVALWHMTPYSLVGFSLAFWRNSTESVWLLTEDCTASHPRRPYCPPTRRWSQPYDCNECACARFPGERRIDTTYPESIRAVQLLTAMLMFSVQIYVAWRRGYVLRNAPLGDFVVLRTCIYANLDSTFKYINQPDASISQLYCLSFQYSSTCFGHPHVHHQELIACSSRLWFTVETWW